MPSLRVGTTKYIQQCWDALEAVAWSQEQHHKFANPVDQFQYLLTALFASKRIHVVDLSTNGPPQLAPEAWGYRKKEIPVSSPTATEDNSVKKVDTNSFEGKSVEDDGEYEDADEEGELTVKYKTIWVPGGTKVGWVTTTDLYLIPEIVFAEIQGLANRLGSPIPLTMPMLEKRLADAGVILRDEKRKRIRHRISAESARQYILLVPIQRLPQFPGWGFPSDDHEEDQDFDELIA